MIRIALWCLAAAIALYVTGCAGTWDTSAHRSTTIRTSIAATDLALLGVDMMQARDMTRHYDMPTGAPGVQSVSEINPLLGDRPSATAVSLYCASWMGAVVASRLWLPTWAQWGVLSTIAAIEVETVWANDRLGLSPSW